MAGLGKCVDGELDPSMYTSPIPFIGLYIAVATSVCFFCMTYDLVYGLFIRKKPFLPCKLFPMNAFTLTMLAVATKIPNDLVTEMPRVEDQLSKLTGVALLCTSLGFYMPSLGSMETSERYGNLAALSVTVITVVVNVCIQIHTGVIFAFTTEHIILMVCITVLLFLMWSSAIAFREKKEYERSVARVILHDSKENVTDFNGLRGLIQSAYKLSYKGNGQTLLCKIPNHHTFGLLCVLSLAVVSQAIVKSFALKSITTCSRTPSDYRWSILIVIVTQFLTILVGSFSILCRWFFLVLHFGKFSLRVGCPQLELEYLKLKTLPFRFPNKKISNFLFVAKDFIVDVLIWTQMLLYKCNILFVVRPICYVKILLESIIHWNFTEEDSTDLWTYDMFIKEMESYRKSCKRDHPSTLIPLISKVPHFGSQCALFIEKLETTGKELNKEMVIYEDYRVSCVSVLVLSGILAELMPSCRRKSLMQSLRESFEIIYFVDPKTHNPSEDDERRWTSSKEVWAHWENPSHWFRTKIISRTYEKFKLEQVDDTWVLSDLKPTLDAIETYFKENKYGIWELANKDSLTEKHMALVSIEFAIICKFIQEHCKFIQEQNSESLVDENLFNFLEVFFVKMLCFTLSGLPLAILREMDGEDPYEIGEERIRKAFKFCCKLEILLDTLDWSWPAAKLGHTDASFATADASAMSFLEFGPKEIV